MFVAGRRRGLGIGLLAAGMVLVSACSGSGSTPQTLPRLSTTPAAATSTAPPTSQAAELAAVKAVVRRYYALLNAPTTVANADALAALMTADCKCREAAKATRDAALANQHYFGHNTLRSVVASLDGIREADVLVTYDYSAGGIADAKGDVMSQGRAHRGASVDIRLLNLGGHWRMSAIIVVRPGLPA